MLLEKRNMFNPNTGTDVDKRKEDFTVVIAYGINWKHSNKPRDMHTHTISHTHREYMSDISESFHSLT